MGQKVSAKANRLGVKGTNTKWDSTWFAPVKTYKTWLSGDIKLRKYFEKMKNSGISKIEIERAEKMLKVIIHTARPGIIIGKKGAGIDLIKKDLEKIAGSPLSLSVQEIKQPDLSAKIVADSIVEQLEKRIPFRRAMKQAIGRTRRAGAEGIRIICSGRLAGAEIARSERAFEGSVPLHTLRADIDYETSEAYTTYGRIGVKVWICKGEILPKRKSKNLSSAETTVKATPEKEGA